MARGKYRMMFISIATHATTAKNSGECNLDFFPETEMKYSFNRKENCAITYDLFNFAKKLETELCCVSDLMRRLKPSFTLVGSVPEHTRIGIANELDITIDFRGWIGNVPFKTADDAYYLYRYSISVHEL